MFGLTAIGLSMVILIPPKKFDVPFKGEIYIVEHQILDVHAYCGGKKGPRMFACAFPLKDKCLIVLPEVEDGWISQEQQKRLLRHETGHCNGWGADHAGGRFKKGSK